MRRKINAVGTGTLTVSLPARWAKENYLKKGDEIDVVEDGKTLKIITSGKHPSRSIRIALKSSKDLAKRALLMPYIRGYDRITVTGLNAKRLQWVEDTLPYLFGFEMTYQERDTCLLQPVAAGLNSEFEAVKQRVFHVISTMLHETLEALQQNDRDALKHIQRRESLMNKLTLFCRRMMHIHRDFSSYTTILLLEDVSDHLKSLCSVYTTSKAPPRVLKLLKDIIKLYELIIAMKQKKSYDNIHECKAQENKVQKQFTAKTKNKEEHQALLALHTIFSDLHNISEEVLI